MTAYLGQLKSTCRRTLGAVLSVAAILAVVVSSFLGWREFPRQVLYQLIVSACVGSLFWLSGPFISSSGGRLGSVAGWGLKVLSWVILVNVGALIGLAVLAEIGALPWQLYGQIFRMAFIPATVIGGICSIGLAMYDTLKYRSQYEMTQAKLSSLESRLRPHFLFNTLNSILALIPEDPAAAERMTLRLSELLRYSLDSTLQGTVVLEREVKMTTDYLEIERTRFGSRIQYSVHVPADLMKAEVPPFCLQTLVENSVKYGGSEIRVTARNGNGRLVLNVWDSGDGFGEREKIVAGHGLHNLRGRLTALWGSKATVEFPRDRDGTVVEISIPSQQDE